jgi:hypothetical protein
MRGGGCLCVRQSLKVGGKQWLTSAKRSLALFSRIDVQQYMWHNRDQSLEGSIERGRGWDFDQPPDSLVWAGRPATRPDELLPFASIVTTGPEKLFSHTAGGGWSGKLLNCRSNQWPIYRHIKSKHLINILLTPLPPGKLLAFINEFSSNKCANIPRCRRIKLLLRGVSAHQNKYRRKSIGSCLKEFEYWNLYKVLSYVMVRQKGVVWLVYALVL